VETITIILAVLTPLCTICAFVAARADTTRKKGKEEGEATSELKDIRRIVEDIKYEQKEMNKNLSILTERIIRVEESTKQAHKRIDEIKIKTAEKTAKE
jgi:septal ring factor EnvC (AmiA/AmiB activator)